MPSLLTPARILLGAVFALTMHPLLAADFPVPAEGDWTIRDFHFRSGAVLPALTLHYRTIGAPSGIPVLLLHGTTQSGASLLAPQFGGALFGSGQPLDASRYFVILPDAIGHGKSSKPSDGLRANFPRYSTEDMVDAQHQLVTEHLGIAHLRMVLGYSMGGMETWIYAQKYPAMMDIAVPMASLPTEMAGRNWILRRLISETIRNDPAWMKGNYTTQPRSAQISSVFFGLATNGGSQALQKAAPTRVKADALLDARLAAPFPADANDVLYQWESSRDYDPSAGLERITATLLAINSADDERNPPELGIMESALRRIKNARLLLVPGSELTAGHGTAFRADLWKESLAELLQTTPQPMK
ncbi:MAG: homoserine O-acetyltransferase [Burkholderiaceae bacterium]|jgi:homoserine O-acetyltransferase